MRIAIEIDGETFHNPYKISGNKYYDDLLKQNSLIYQNWKVYRWAYRQLKNQREKVKDEWLLSLGKCLLSVCWRITFPNKEVKLSNSKTTSRLPLTTAENEDNGESIALLYHAPGGEDRYRSL
jgi:hypothetical protein